MCTETHCLFELFAVEPHGRRHVVDPVSHASDLIPAKTMELPGEITCIHPTYRLFSLCEAVKHAALEEPDGEKCQACHHGEQQQPNGKEQPTINDRVNIHDRDIVPAKLIEIPDPDKTLATFHTHEGGGCLAAVTAGVRHHVRECRAIIVTVDEVEDRAPTFVVPRDAVKFDATGVSGRLDGTVGIDEKAFHACLFAVDDSADEGRQIDARPNHTEQIIALPDNAIDPDLRHLELVVIVHVELAARARSDCGIVPTISRIVGRQAVAQLVASVAAVTVVEVVVARGMNDKEVAAVDEGLAVVLQFGEPAVAQRRDIFGSCPVHDDGRAR